MQQADHDDDEISCKQQYRRSLPKGQAGRCFALITLNLAVPPRRRCSSLAVL